LCPKFLTKEEVQEKIELFLADHNYPYSENVVVQKRLKAIDYLISTSDSKIAIMLFMWNRSLPYDKVYYLEEYLNKYEIDKVILICRQISPRAKEIIRKEKISIEIIFESDFRTMKSSPLIGKF
jgi:YesN/AraC family two-component response regulator